MIDDVFQFIFIDLCLQLLEDEQTLPEKIKRKLLGDSKNKRKGFDCGKKYVVHFTKEFLGYIQSQQLLRERMLTALTKPIGPTPF